MKRIRSLSLVLVLMLVLGLLPTKASAVYCIDRLECYADPPIVGEAVIKDICSVPEGEQDAYSVRVIGWYVGEKWETARPAEEGELADRTSTYWIQVEFTPLGAHMVMRDTQVILNHRPADVVEYIDAGTMRAARKMNGQYWGIGEAPLRVVPPFVGEEPRFLVDYPENDRYTVSGVTWRKGRDWDSLEFMEFGETFAAGETYWAIVTIIPGESYIVGDPGQVTINGQALDPHSSENPYNHHYDAVCSFTPREPEILTRVEVSVEAPAAKQPLSYRVVSADPEKYAGYVGDWYQGNQLESARRLHDEDSFAGGYNYWVEAVVFPEPGYRFQPDPNGWPVGISMTINGLPAEDVSFNERGDLKGVVRLFCPAERDYVFIDVSGDAYYSDAVYWAADSGIVSGTSDTTFSPDAPCTRAQAMTFLWRASGRPAPTGTANPFRDVPDTAYYRDAVLWAVEKGITAGLTSDTFGPDVTCTRGQIVKFLWNSFGRPTVSGSNPFRDVAPGKYYEQAVLWAVKKGITRGLTPDTFGPENGCTRGQIVCFFRNMAR